MTTYTADGKTVEGRSFGNYGCFAVLRFQPKCYGVVHRPTGLLAGPCDFRLSAARELAKHYVEELGDEVEITDSEKAASLIEPVFHEWSKSETQKAFEKEWEGDIEFEDDDTRADRIIKVLEFFAPRRVTLDAIIQKSEMSYSETVATLCGLEIQRKVRQHPDKEYTLY